MSDTDVEVDGGQVLRPEQFHLPAVSGMTVPLLLNRDGKLIHEWQLALHWRDGRRECVSLDDILQVGDRQVFLRPRPGAPQSSHVAKWTTGARKAWLRGEASMPPDELCRRLLTAFAKYLEIQPDAAAGTVAALTCWTVMTYIHSVFDAVPYLAIGGTQESGKTRVLELLEQVVFRPFMSSSLSNSALFRQLDAYGGAMLIDEGEQLGHSKNPATAEVLASLLAGYRRGKTVSRSEPLGDGDFRPRQYCVWGPKAIACINELAPTLASRSIPIRMIRAAPSSAKPRLRIGQDHELWSDLRDALHAMALTYGADWPLLPQRQEVCPEMSGRNYEIWQPVLAIADWFERHGAEGLYGTMREHAVRTIEATSDTTVPAEDEVVLRALGRLVADQKRTTAKAILQACKEGESSLFRDWSERRIAACLKRYGLSTRRSHGQSLFEPSVEVLSRIQGVYRVDIDSRPAPVGHVPQSLLLDGAHGAHGAHTSRAP
jgi:hypothetical protein